MLNYFNNTYYLITIIHYYNFTQLYASAINLHINI